MSDPTPQPQPVGELLQDLAARARAAQAAANAAGMGPAEPDAPPVALDPAADDVDRWLAREAMEPGEDDEPEFQAPEDAAQADRLLGVLKFLQRELADIDTTHATRVAELDRWKAERHGFFDGEIARIEQLLEGWTRAVHVDSHPDPDKRTLSWKLSNGTLRLTANRTKVHVLDTQASPGLLIGAGYKGFTSTVETTTVAKNAVAEHAKADGRQGPPVAEQSALAPEGYVAHHIVAPDADPDDGVFLPGVYLLVPIEARSFKAVPR